MKTLFTFACALFMIFSAFAQETHSPTNQFKHPVEFQFSGGSLINFIDAIKASFGIDLNNVATVPEAMYGAIVPKLRLNAETIAPLNRTRLDLADVLRLYNSVSEKGDSSLGRWIMEAFSGGEPQTILLVPIGPHAESGLSVKAFALPAAADAQASQRMVKLLESTVYEQKEALRREGYAGLSQADLRGRLDFHLGTGIVVATGGRLYVEMAASIIEAFKEQTKESGWMTEVPIPAKPKASQP